MFGSDKLLTSNATSMLINQMKLKSSIYSVELKKKILAAYRILESKDLAHQWNTAQHQYHICSRLECFESTVDLCVPIERILRIQISHWFFIALECIEQHSKHKHPQICSAVHLALSQHCFNGLYDMILIEKVRN